MAPALDSLIRGDATCRGRREETLLKKGFPPSSLLPRTPTSHLPKTFNWWGGCAKEVRSDVKWKKTFLCTTEKNNLPLSFTIPPSVFFGGKPPEKTRRRVKGRLAPCGVQRQRLCRGPRGGALGFRHPGQDTSIYIY